jgi:hypothetical protein
MDKRLLALKLVLVELSVPIDVSSIDNRKAMQKAIYLAQAAGVHLGYSFSWYVKGPYSPRLADDYYLAASENDAGVNRRLRSDLQERLRSLRPFLNAPSQVQNLSRADWLELLASWHYLRVSRDLTNTDAQQKLAELKPRLTGGTPDAEKALLNAGLLAASAS